MRAYVQRLIREAVAELGVYMGPNQGKSLDRMYFPRAKLLSLVLKIYKRYGYSGTYDQGTKATYDRVMTALQNDPHLDNVEVDEDFVKDFTASLLQKNIKTQNPLLIGKAITALHGSQIKTGHLHVIIGIVAQYCRQASMSASKDVAVNEPVLFYKLRLKRATYDGRVRANMPFKGPPKIGSCTFQDQKGNWYIKRGAPPSIHMRSSIGKGIIFSKNPYELRDGDVFTFRGRVSRSFTTTHGYVINIIDGIQPI